MAESTPWPFLEMARSWLGLLISLIRAWARFPSRLGFTFLTSLETRNSKMNFLPWRLRDRATERGALRRGCTRLQCRATAPGPPAAGLKALLRPRRDRRALSKRTTSLRERHFNCSIHR